MTLGNSNACETGFDASTGTLTLDFVEADKIEAGVAYIVKWDTPAAAVPEASASGSPGITNPMFRGVTVADEAPEAQATVSHDGSVQFLGTYSPVDIYTDDKANLYLADDGTLCSPFRGSEGSSYNVSACTAYFQLLNGLTADDSATGVHTFRLIFGGEDPVGISLTTASSPNGEGSDYWFDLSGRKIVNSKSSNRKLNRGVYINNGTKVVIK